MILTPRDRQICALLVQGWDNPAIGKELKIAERTVKAHLGKLYFLFGIKTGVKRVHLAKLLNRRADEWLNLGPEHGTLLLSKGKSGNLSQRDSKTERSRANLDAQRELLKTTSAEFLTKLESGRAWNLLCGMRREITRLSATNRKTGSRK